MITACNCALISRLFLFTSI